MNQDTAAVFNIMSLPEHDSLMQCLVVAAGDIQVECSLVLWMLAWGCTQRRTLVQAGRHTGQQVNFPLLYLFYHSSQKILFYVDLLLLISSKGM